MIALVFAMVWARRAQAAALILLSMFGVAAAVAAPAYLRAADRAVAAGQVRAAAPGDRSVALTVGLPDQRQGADPASGDPRTLRTAAGLTAMPGFDYVYAQQVDTIGLEKDTDQATKLVFRQDVCDHLTFVAGRCAISESDVTVSEDTAQRLNLHPGQAISLEYAVWLDDPLHKTYVSAGRPKQLLLTGVYRVNDPGEPYWAAHDYFEGRQALFVTEATMNGMDLGARTVSVDGYAGPHALDVDNLPAIRPALHQLQEAAGGQAVKIVLRTGLPGLLTRIDAGRADAHRIVPVLAVSLVLLACLTIFLAVGYGAESRRPELAVVALRGARAPQRWWLATGENVVAIGIGAILGSLAGQLLVNLVSAVRFPGVGADPGIGSLRWAPVTFAVAVLTAVLAERRQLRTPVLDLLRRVPAARGAGPEIVFELVVLLLAVIATVQLVSGGGALKGLGQFATALLLIAAAMLAARLIMWVVAAFAQRSLERGRLGFALSVLHLSRRPGGVRVLALLTAAVAVAGYAACAVDNGARGRHGQADLQVGAARVVTVQPVAASRVLAVVHDVDPEARFAMAAVTIPTGSDSPPVLAVDTTRLAAVASWPDSGPGAAATARLLHPAAANPVRLPGGSKPTVDIEAKNFGPGHPDVAFRVSSGAGADQIWVRDVAPGRRSYTLQTGVCADGCTLDSIRVYRPGNSKEISGTLLLRGLTGAWRSSEGGRAESVADGLRVEVNLVTGDITSFDVQPPTAPNPLPAATAGPSDAISAMGLDGLKVPISRAETLPLLPGIGGAGTLIDLDYANRLATGTENLNQTQVWLSAKAPADAVERLQKAGLTPLSDVRSADVKATLDAGGPALGLIFYVLVAALAVLLAAGALILMASVDRSRRVEDLSALRVQGLPAAALRRATLWTYPLLIAVAVVAGLVIGVACWRGTGWALPLGFSVPVSPWPSVRVLLGTAAAVLLALAAVAAVAGYRLRRLIK